MLATDEEKVVAWLHDVIEDTDVTLADLRAEGFSDEVLEAVGLLTHAEDVSYEEYTDTLADNELAAAVKKVDLVHNTEKVRVIDFPKSGLYENAWKTGGLLNRSFLQNI